MSDASNPSDRDPWENVSDGLEKIVNKNPDLFSDPSQWLRGMVRAMWAVCRIENPEGRAWGTGFLIAPDLVVTNNHVVCGGGINESPSQVRCRFGFLTRAAGSRGQSKTYQLANLHWLAHSSPTENGGLDYAVLRLDSKAGLDYVNDLPTNPHRGWIRVSTNPPVQGLSLLTLQHPGGDTLKLADGHVQAITPPWLSYQVNTEYGSSGSPVFDNRWELVALHSRRDSTQPLNKGILFSAILQNLPDAIREEIRSRVPPSNMEISEMLLEHHDLAPAKIELRLVEAHLAALDDNELKLLTSAVLDVARSWTSGSSAEGSCDLGSDHQLWFCLNVHAIRQRGQVMGLQGTLELVEANEVGLQHKRHQQMLNLNPGVPWTTLIAQQTRDLEDVRNELRGKLRLFLRRLR